MSGMRRSMLSGAEQVPEMLDTSRPHSENDDNADIQDIVLRKFPPNFRPALAKARFWIEAAVNPENDLQQQRLPHPVLAAIGIILAVAATWIFTFGLNTLLDPVFFEHIGVSWLFIPAGVRLLAVVLYRWKGAFGICVGSFVTSLYLYEDPVFITGTSIISGAAPWIVLQLLELNPGFRQNLADLSWLNLLLMCLMFALVNVTLTQGFFVYMGTTGYSAVPEISLAMFIGDLSGAILVMASVFFLAPRLGIIKKPARIFEE